MKVNVTVDLADFYSEEDGASFSSQIKDSIAYQVKQEVLKDWKIQIMDEFSKSVKAEIEQQKESFITSVLTELICESKVKPRYGNKDELITIKEWMNDELERTTLSGSSLKDFLRKQTTATSNRISKELKDRYDLLFASQIVSKLNENGMLKEDVAKLILDK